MRSDAGSGARQWHQGRSQEQRETHMCIFIERKERKYERRRVLGLNSASTTDKLCDFGQVYDVSEPVS